MSDYDQFYAVLTSKRDEGLSHITEIIDRSGVDEFCDFMIKNIFPVLRDNGKSEIHGNMAELLIAHMALVGAADALLAHRDRENL